MEKREWRRPASSGEGEIFSRLWVGENPQAIVVVAHGMAEHSARYDEFATYLTGRGYLVCMNDHAGHGQSAITQGHFADENGWEAVVADLHALREEVSAEYPALPVFLMGHSMGSFLSRSYIIRHEGLAGCILCGTMGRNPAAGFGRCLAGLQKKLCGAKSPGRLLDKLSTGSYNKGIEKPVNKFAWLSTVEKTCLSYAADEHCGFAFTAAGYYDLFSGLLEVNGKEWFQRVPKDLPLLLVAGDKDPVGNNGKGPAQVYDKLKNSGHKVSLKLYPGMRHELLNESCKEEVFEDIFVFLQKCLHSSE